HPHIVSLQAMIDRLIDPALVEDSIGDLVESKDSDSFQEESDENQEQEDLYFASDGMKESEIESIQNTDTKMEKGQEVISDEKVSDMKEGEKQKIEYPYNIDEMLTRKNIYDEVTGVALGTNMFKELKEPLTISSRSEDLQIIEGKMAVSVSEQWVMITSPAPGSMLTLQSYEAMNSNGENVNLEFSYGGKTDALYVRAKGFKGEINIQFQIGMDNSVYFGQTIPEYKSIHFNKPSNIPEFIKDSFQYIKVNERTYDMDTYAKNKHEFVYDLIEFFRDFRLEEDGIEHFGHGDNSFSKILSSKCGVCRHRSDVFFILTKYLGFKVRNIRTQVHAFVEIYVDGYGWVRIDLGGGGDPVNYDFSHKPELQDIEEQGDFREPDTQNYREQRENFGRRMQESNDNKSKKSGSSGEKGSGESGINGSLEEQKGLDGKSEKIGGLEGEGEVLDEIELPVSALQKDMMALENIAPNLLTKFLDIFAGNPKTIKIYSDNGDEIDIEKIIAGDLEPFYRLKVLQGVADLSAGITVDISGSIRGELQSNFITMTKLYSSLFHYAAIRNKSVDFSIGAVGDNYYNLLNHENSRERNFVENALIRLNRGWNEGGINTLSVINGIREKYQNKKHKEHKMEIIFTDGGETSGESFESLREKVEELEKELGIDIVFIGINTDDVENYSKYLNLSGTPSSEAMVQLIMNLSMLKVLKGSLPQGDLKEVIQISSSPLAEFMKPDQSLGGIDFNPNNLNLQIKRDGKGIALPMDMQDIENINIQGLFPVIINITPVINLQLLGLSKSDENKFSLFSCSTSGEESDSACHKEEILSLKPKWESLTG
ncbi:hypothetical protein MNBD_UNCLBAC01-1880, partial [hydrothermal vent metagenome]